MRRLSVLALFALGALACASPAAAQLDDFKNNGSIPECKYNNGQLGGALGDVPPDVEQYAPGYADELRDAQGANCPKGGSGSGSGSGSTGPGGVESVPAPGSSSGGGGPGGSGGGGADGASVKVNAPPVPKPDARKRLANASSPAVATSPGGPDVPTWVLVLGAAVLLLATGLSALYLLGADFSRLTRPLGTAAGDARARTSDRAIQLWETARFGR